MIRKIVHRILVTRHPWRLISFTELSEMYITGFLRTMSIGLVGIFVPIYLLTQGHTLTDVLLYYGLFYGFGVFFNIGVGYLVARFGPKHVMRVSFILQMLFSLLLADVTVLPFAVPILALVSSAASIMYFVPYHVGFSKLKSSQNGGKELGFLSIMERLGGVLGPILGGVVAALVAPQATFVLAAIAMLIASIILMFSPEPVQTKQKLRFKGLFQQLDWRNQMAIVAQSVEYSIKSFMWPIFLSAVVFVSEVYLKLGVVSSLSTLIGALVAFSVGRAMDKSRASGQKMVLFGSIINSVIHMFRIFVGGLPSSLTVAALNEPNTLVYRMPIIKGIYDEADDHPGYRIAYVVTFEVMSDLARSSFWIMMALLSPMMSSYQICIIGFAIAAFLSLLLNVQNFRALRD